MELAEETSVVVYYIIKVIDNFKLKNKTTLSASNYDGLKKAGEDVFTKLKSNLGKAVLSLGCGTYCSQ